LYSLELVTVVALIVCRITGNILAMARPNTPFVEKYDIIKSFKK